MKNIALLVLAMFIISCNENNEKADAYGNFETTEITVSSESNGKIEFLNLEEGDVVEKGKTVGLIDTLQLYYTKMQLIASQKTVSSKSGNVLSQKQVLQEQLKTAKIEQTRIKNMFSENAATKRQVDEINGKVKVIEEQIKGYFPAALADLTARAQSGGAVAYDSRRLYDGEYMCVMRQGHPLATGELSLDTYCAARHMLVSFSGRPFGFIDEALASLGRTRRVVITVNQFFTAGRVVVGSDLLTVLPRHFIPVTGIADKLVQRPLPLNVPAVHVDALWRRRGPQEKAMEWLLHALARSARSMFRD